MTLYKIGAAFQIDGHPGVWLVIRSAAEQAAADPALAGTVRMQKVFDGAGPSHLSANARLAELHPVEDNPTPEVGDDADECAALYGVRLTAANGVVTVPMHPAAYASPWHTTQAAGHLQAELGLQVDAYLVEFVFDRWADRDLPAPTLPAPLIPEVVHNHAYWDASGDEVVVGPCRDLQTCRTSLAMAEARAQRLNGQPRFAEVDLDAARRDARDSGDIVEYGMRYTQHGALFERTVEGLTFAAHAVRLTRDLQATLGEPVDCMLLARRPATDTRPPGPWHEVAIAPDAVGEPRELLGPARPLVAGTPSRGKSRAFQIITAEGGGETGVFWKADADGIDVKPGRSWHGDPAIAVVVDEVTLYTPGTNDVQRMLGDGRR